MTDALISAVTGAGAVYIVTVNTGFSSGTIRLDVLDDDSFKDASNQTLGGVGTGNGNFNGETYTVERSPNVGLSMGGALKGEYFLTQNESKSYANTNNGPVNITTLDGSSLIAAQRVIYRGNNVNTSFSEMMALPASQSDTKYWLPWYNNASASGLDTQLRFGVP